MARRHVMTPARRVALRKAQLASARKRHSGARPRHQLSPRTRRNIKRTVVSAGVLTVAAGAYAGGKYSLNHPAKFGGAGKKLDTGITKAYWAITPMHKHVPWAKELPAHKYRSVTTTRAFMGTRRKYQTHPEQMSVRSKVAYREYTHQRAVHRLRKLKGQKTQHFDYGSGMPNRELDFRLYQGKKHGTVPQHTHSHISRLVKR